MSDLLKKWWRRCSGLKLTIFGDFVCKKSGNRVGVGIEWGTTLMFQTSLARNRNGKSFGREVWLRDKWPSRILLSALANSTLMNRKISSNKAMRLTRNEHHRKLRAPIGDISDWLINANVSGFATPAGEWLHQCTWPGR